MKAKGMGNEGYLCAPPLDPLPLESPPLESLLDDVSSVSPAPTDVVSADVAAVEDPAVTRLVVFSELTPVASAVAELAKSATPLTPTSSPSGPHPALTPTTTTVHHFLMLGKLPGSGANCELISAGHDCLCAFHRHHGSARAAGKTQRTLAHMHEFTRNFIVREAGFCASANRHVRYRASHRWQV